MNANHVDLVQRTLSAHPLPSLTIAQLCEETGLTANQASIAVLRLELDRKLTYNYCVSPAVITRLAGNAYD